MSVSRADQHSSFSALLCSLCALCVPARVPASRRGFTFVEVIVAIVVLAVLAGAIAPRLTSPAARRARVELQAVEQALSAAAMRDAISSQRMAIDWSADGVIAALSEGPRPEDPSGPRIWRPDPLIAPARLEELSLVGAAADIDRLGPGPFRIEFPRTGRRPDIDLHFVDSRGIAWRAVLPSGAARAIAGPAAEVEPLAAGSVIDLDQAGQGRRPW